MNAHEVTTVVPAASASRGSSMRGRSAECEILDKLVAHTREGSGQAVVLRGEAGVGKTVLLEYLAGRASDAGCQVISSTGTRPEMEWSFAGLHQLFKPMLHQAEWLPGPQRDALATVLGLTSGPPPNRLLLGLAVLGLLSRAGTDRPLICVVDDAQWLDRASAQTLAFAARRLVTFPVALVFATRDLGAELAGLPELAVEGLNSEDARALLAAGLAAPLDERVRELIVAETRGNPQTLVNLSRGSGPADLAGGFRLPDAGVLAGGTTDGFAAQLADLPPQTRRLVQLAAADLSGDPSLMWRAAGRLGIPFQAAIPAEEAGLVGFSTHARFRHLSERSAAYRSASFADRRQMHEALAEVTNPATDPDRRAWHRAQAANGADEEVAVALESCTGAAQAHGGLAAAAAFLGRAVALTADPDLRADRILAAAQANLWAGDFDKALELLVTAEVMPLDELASARVGLLRGQIAFAAGPSGDAHVLLLKAAKRLAALDTDLAREAYLSAWMAAQSAGSGWSGGDPLEVCCAAGAQPSLAGLGTRDLVLSGLVMSVTEGPQAAAPVLRRAVSALTNADITAEEAFRWGWVAPAAAGLLWDGGTGRALLARLIEKARRAGALGQLPFLLVALGTAAAATGDLTSATDLGAEADAIRSVTGASAGRDIALVLASMRGDQAAADPLIDAAINEAKARGHGLAVLRAQSMAAMLHNGLGQYDQALAAGRQAIESIETTPLVAMRALPELVEAATRAGDDGIARDALKRLAEITQSCGNDPALGVEARCRALLSDGAAADRLYREAIDRLGRTELRPELARARLLYGEWLRREGRRTSAREQLRAASEAFAAMGMDAFAERAQRELQATGERARKRTAETVSELTAQEALIARLAGEGHSNPQIGAKLFLSPRTVQYHLTKVFSKLGIGSRGELRAALTGASQGFSATVPVLTGSRS